MVPVGNNEKKRKTSKKIFKEMEKRKEE